eukprot:164827_1
MSVWNTLVNFELDFNNFTDCTYTLHHLKNDWIVVSNDTIHIFKHQYNRWDKYQAPIGTYHTATLDKNNTMLYINDSKSNVFIMNLQTNFYKQKCIASDNSGDLNASMIINNQFHIFNNNKHMIWNNTFNKFILQSNTPNDLNAWGCGIIHISSKKCLLKLGGMTDVMNDAIDSIYCYDLINKIWTKLHLTLPKPLKFVKCVLTNDEKYIIIMGGRTINSDLNKDIFVMNTMKMSIKKSKITLKDEMFQSTFLIPAENDLHINILSNKTIDELLSHGFIRNTWEEKHFENIMYIPYYLIQIITQYYNNEYLHVMECKAKRWKIKLDDILIGM